MEIWQPAKRRPFEHILRESLSVVLVFRAIQAITLKQQQRCDKEKSEIASNTPSRSELATEDIGNLRVLPRVSPKPCPSKRHLKSTFSKSCTPSHFKYPLLYYGLGATATADSGFRPENVLPDKYPTQWFSVERPTDLNQTI